MPPPPSRPRFRLISNEGRATKPGPTAPPPKKGFEQQQATLCLISARPSLRLPHKLRTHRWVSAAAPEEVREEERCWGGGGAGSVADSAHKLAGCMLNSSGVADAALEGAAPRSDASLK